MSETFKRKIEDFVCEHCGHEVRGDGYTNHCPECLWSKHVDEYPGDRAENCGGLMKPTSLVQEKGELILTHRCVKCRQNKRNRTNPQDNLTLML